MKITKTESVNGAKWTSRQPCWCAEMRAGPFFYCGQTAIHCLFYIYVDWNKNFYKEGTDATANGIPIRRFRVRKRDAKAFDKVNAELMSGRGVSADKEDIFLSEMVNSPDLYSYIDSHKDEYGLFVFIPYSEVNIPTSDK